MYRNDKDLNKNTITTSCQPALNALRPTVLAISVQINRISFKMQSYCDNAEVIFCIVNADKSNK